jgi:hypothetical protein
MIVLYKGMNYDPAELRKQYTAWQVVVNVMSVLWSSLYLFGRL